MLLFAQAGMEATSSLPTVTPLISEVTHAQAVWEGKKEKGFGAFKKNILAFAESLDGYETLFGIFTSGERYTSLISGVVSTMVKISETRLVCFRCVCNLGSILAMSSHLRPP